MELTHLDSTGKAKMVDVSTKSESERVAVAKGEVKMQPATLSLMVEGGIPKGDVFAAARLAGIMAAKQTPRLIPLCHPLNIDSVTVDLEPRVDQSLLEITATVKITAKTGVEMEALTAVSVAALTVYDMAKAVDKGMVIQNIRLVRKTGGKSGDYIRPE